MDYIHTLILEDYLLIAILHNVTWKVEPQEVGFHIEFEFVIFNEYFDIITLDVFSCHCDEKVIVELFQGEVWGDHRCYEYLK